MTEHEAFQSANMIKDAWYEVAFDNGGRKPAVLIGRYAGFSDWRGYLFDVDGSSAAIPRISFRGATPVDM